jgi:hypothetical protein
VSFAKSEGKRSDRSKRQNERQVIIKNIKKKMKRIIVLMFAVMFAGGVWGQPQWMDEDMRETKYPSSVFITGFAQVSLRQGETNAIAQARAKKEAQGYVAEAIRVQVSSTTNENSTSTKYQASGKEATEEIKSVFESAVKTSATAEITGVKTESYVSNDGLIYGFAYVNKYELIGYYNASLTMNLQQLESIVNTAVGLENSGDKAKARKQYEDAVPLLIKVEQAQDILIALDGNANVQRQQTAKYRSDIIAALARLSQGVYIYVEDTEDMFGKKSTLIANGIKAKLSKNGCSFTANKQEADYVLKLNASARKHGNPDQIVFCYADVEVELIKTQNNKTLYQEELKQKGGHTTYENAAREAFNDVGKVIADKLLDWVK